MAFDVSPWTWVAAALFLFILFVRRKKSSLPLPPGPAQLPVIGNLLDIPTKDIPAAYRDMSARYGDVVHLNVMGQSIIVIGSHEVAIELLEKRFTKYSDRPHSPMIDIAGFAWSLALQGYSARWRRHRKAMHQYFNSNVVKNYAPFQLMESHRFVKRLLDSPDNFLAHVRLFFGSSIMRISYGIEVDGEPVDYPKLAETVLAIFSEVFLPGKYLVDRFPVLRHVPEWVPGAQFKRDGAKWTKIVNELVTTPWKVAVGKMVHVSQRGDSTSLHGIWPYGTNRTNRVAEEIEIAMNATAVAYSAGADTTISTVQTFFIAMAMHPEVQQKAGAELDAVVGQQRLPDFADSDSLLYIRAVVKELLRWRSVVPIGVPRRCMEDDEYRGYLIPKGSVIITNIWAFSRDSSVYPAPERFMPERWIKDGRINPDVRDSASMAFGYGRRVCPGRHFAETSLFMVVATVLHTLRISPPQDIAGKTVPLMGKMTDGLISYPEPFDCVIKPRSEAAEALIRAAPWTLDGQ